MRFGLIGVLLAGVFVDGLFAEDKAADDPPELAKLNVVVTDEAGEPVAGAEVKPYFMRNNQAGLSRLWDYQTYGPPPVGVSNQDGVAVLEYPAQLTLGPERAPTTNVHFLVQHTEFVQKRVDFRLGPSEAKVRMQRGCEIQVTAVNETTRQPVETFGVIVAGTSTLAVPVDLKDGELRTGAIPEGTWQTMVVQPQADGPTLFSEVMPIRTKRQRVMRLQNIWLSPGTVLRGKLSQNVPRPVSGYVVAEAVPSPAGRISDAENPSLVWYDWVEIAEDGRFEFESLPRGGEVHLMAFCDGWLAETDPDLDGANAFKMGQVFRLDDQTVDVELKMEPTGTLEVEFLSPDGTPITEGEVSSWPNQWFYKGGGGVLGHRIRSLYFIKNQFLPPDKRLQPADHDLEVPFQKRVNPDGVTVLTGLPLNFGLRVYLLHDRLRLQGTASPFDGVSYQLNSTKPKQMTLKTMVSKPKQQSDTP